MLKLEDIKKGAQICGIHGDDSVRVVQVEWVGDNALTVYYKDNQGSLSEQMLIRSDESRLHLAKSGHSWAFDAQGEDFKLGLEAYRIKLAYFFDPMIAVHTANVEPLPHQISAVYEAMLPCQPLRFVLADDPGSGKTIMAGLLICELLMRADAKRILIVVPGSLTEQWQNELIEKFGIRFEIFSREKQDQCSSGNYFNEQNQVICRLDQLSRNSEYKDKLKNTNWDLIIVDEAHKLSANYFGNKIYKTLRFQLGELLASITRHFLMITATPHQGKAEDFQIWLSLLDGDRFYGKFREGAQNIEISDIMRRMVKEELLKFDGTPLFPERRAYSVSYELSDVEETLYEMVTNYVRNEMNRAERLNDDKRKGNVGFALTLLQRRLASSPEAIYRSLKRRKRRLEEELIEVDLVSKTLIENTSKLELKLSEDFNDIEDSLTAEEYEFYSDEVINQASAAVTIPELKAEILILKDLEHLAFQVVQSGDNKKWEQLSNLLQKEESEMYNINGERRKLIIFTEHKDTLNYLTERVSSMLGNPNAVVTIHGGINRDERRRVQEEFRNNPDVLIMVATDAASEGINLQNANLMVNYDLPWNPNRMEQRFGRIHRIGQTEVCHVWNLIAKNTREGYIFQKLFDKLEVVKQALGGKVFDILGEAFENRPLKELLIEAICYGESPEVKARLNKAIDGVLDTNYLKEILKRNALFEQHVSLQDLYNVKDAIERAEARKLQPYFIRAFFTEAFQKLGGEIRIRESERFEIRHVPAKIREHDCLTNQSRAPVLKKYERICFKKELINVHGKPMADLIHPGHPLMLTITDLILSTHRNKLKQGSVLVNPNDEGVEPRILFLLEHIVREASNGKSHVASRQIQFVKIDQSATAFNAGYAPHLDLEPINENDMQLVRFLLDEPWISTDLEFLALNYASRKFVPDHYQQVRDRRERQADKVLSAVQERLVKEISYLSDRYVKLSEDVSTGKQHHMQLENHRRQIEELNERLENRKRELKNMKSVVSSTPLVIGGALVIPQGLLSKLQGKTPVSANSETRARIERIAMHAVMELERGFGHEVKDVSSEKCGWDVTASPPQNTDGSLKPNRHIEVKGRAKGQSTITISRNEIIYALNQKDIFLLAVVIVDNDNYELHYIRNPFISEPDFSVASVNYDLGDLLSKAVAPEKTL